MARMHYGAPALRLKVSAANLVRGLQHADVARFQTTSGVDTPSIVIVTPEM